MRLSIVSTMYGSAGRLVEFHERARRAAVQIADEVEFVLVNDGSLDDSLGVALGLRERDPWVTVLDLSRNFGHDRAMMAGLAHCTGDLVFLIDCDLEEEPEWIGPFHARMSETGADVAYGVQGSRRGGPMERLSGSLFYSAFNALSSVRLPANQVTARLMSRRYVQSLLSYPERELFIDGIWYDAGYAQVPVEVTKHRLPGASSYTLGRKLSLAVTAITSFSDRPLVLIFHSGLAISLSALLFIGITVARRVALQIDVPGYTSLMASIWLLGGLNILFLGIIGLYLSKVFVEGKRRPLVIVRRKYGRQGAGPQVP